MTKKAVIPPGAWPALLRDEYAAAYVGESSVETLMSRVGTLWPKPFMETGTGKGRYRVWRKSDFDRIIDPEPINSDMAGW